MDVDEMEHDLLSKFDNMQTLDREDLVSQMLRLVGGSGLTKESASFYLEMNAWNVQVFSQQEKKQVYIKKQELIM